jgi:hypothetical protein
MSEQRHVIHAKDGRWAVVKRANHPAEGVYVRKRDAEAAAKEIVRNSGGGEVVLHTPAGTITEVDTVVAPKD